MCKHILNAQVAVRAPCCRKFFDCPECHAETQDHALAKTTVLAFLCKKCRRAFRKDMEHYEDADEFCPHCDNHYVIEAKTPQLMLQVEGEDGRVDPSMIRDDRARARISAEDHGSIDHGGYQAAALAFQQDLANGNLARASAPLPSLVNLNNDDLDWE
ncbi:hypothetical protein MVES1_003375 [Malassezia vespertilionis]|uniref:CHY-type domain-containing protein n=1 Tax=Malassezia vespertilionis TaxID=2020962 RepID=A0A2N1J756_9BASI|nr:uncharacterized protein MVES1_003375 [Malassezia vespertilionis]PKI82395.1 hypothetical protein MVES_003616 [Malassezia vespertilionis]WFD08006.1 hypothetical protein MVES1_003375 [Malassezia vespertilionis]